MTALVDRLTMKRFFTALALSVIAASRIAAEEPSTVLEQARAHFDAWDADHNHTLTITELDLAIAKPEVKGPAAAAAVALKRGTKDKTARITLDTVAADKIYQDYYTTALTRITKASRQLFETQPPKIDTLHQGKTGDCFCLAALRTVLQREPTAITTMINPRSDSGFDVTLGNKKVRVPALTDGELAIGASSSNGLWPLVYEKAVGIYRTKPDAKDATPFNVATKGGSAGEMMSLLTQHEIKRWSCKTWRTAPKEHQTALLNQVRKDFTLAFAENRLVTGGTAALPKGKTGIPSITYNHGYAVLGYDADKDEVHLWNPHGDSFKPKGPPGLENGYPRVKGEFRAPLTELVTFFGGFAFEQD